MNLTDRDEVDDIAVTDHVVDPPPVAHRHCDRAFSLVEMLIVIVILGVLATVTVIAVRGVTASGEEAVCVTEHQTVAKAVETYFTYEGVETIPATGAGADRFEQTLVDSGYIRSTSSLYDLDADGELTPVAGTGC